MSMYKTWGQEQIENLLSQFLVNSWSYSSVSTFSRNEKVFEMEYIYGQRTKNSATTIAGQAYHHALEKFFSALKAKETPLTLPDLEIIAFEFIDDREATAWKLQKTSPTIEDCRLKATKTAGDLLKNFFSEINTYLDEIDEILEVEIFIKDFITLNGVDIPLPLHAKIDLIFRSKEGKIVITDHKSKSVFTSEEDIKLSTGIQAITYVKAFEAKTEIVADEVWFIENKYSSNRDKSSQLSLFKVVMDADTIRLYEALLYEPVRRMLTAVNDPDYVYLINDSDNMVDKAELYEFWCKTMIGEIEDFNVDPDKAELVTKRLKKIRDVSIGNINPNVIKTFRQNASQFIQYDLSNKNMTPEEKIEHVLRSFGIIVRVEHKFEGYSSSTFLLEVSAGVKLNSIQSRKLDIANALNVSTVRISQNLTVHEDKSYLAIEFAKKRDKDLMFEESDLVDLKIPIGRDNYNQVVIWDLNNHSTPHMLVCGATGSGKSVHIKNIIEYAKLAGIKSIKILDPKHEFRHYDGNGIEVYTDIEDIEAALELEVEEMNNRVKFGHNNNKTLIVFDEFADALASAGKGIALRKYETQMVGYDKKGREKYEQVHVGDRKPLEENLRILLQKGRSSGYRIVAATQRASVKVITGDAKVNFPVQVCFRVPKEADSRVVLDEGGAEGLTGRGDGLIKSPEYPDTVRFQAYYKA